MAASTKKFFSVGPGGRHCWKFQKVLESTGQHAGRCVCEFSNGSGGTPRSLEPASHSGQFQCPFADGDQGTGKLVPCHGNRAVQSQAASKVQIFVSF